MDTFTEESVADATKIGRRSRFKYMRRGGDLGLRERGRRHRQGGLDRRSRWIVGLVGLG